MKRLVEIDCRAVFLVEVEAPDEKSAVEQAELTVEELIEADVDTVFSVTDCGPTDEAIADEDLAFGGPACGDSEGRARTGTERDSVVGSVIPPDGKPQAPEK